MHCIPSLLLTTAMLCSGGAFAGQTSASVHTNTHTITEKAQDSSGTKVGEDSKLQTPKELEIVPVKKFSTEDATEIMNVVKNYIKTNPDEFMQLIQFSMQFKEAKQEEKTRGLLDKYQGELLSEDKSIVLGNPKGTVTLVLIADPRCSNCNVLWTMLNKIIKTQPALKVIIHQWPFISEESSKVAHILQAAWQENPAQFPKLWEGALALQKAPTDDELKALVEGAKYSAEKVRDRAKTSEVTTIIDANSALAKNLEFPGVPILLAKEPEGKLLVIPPLAEPEMSKIISELAKEASAKGKATKKAA